MFRFGTGGVSLESRRKEVSEIMESNEIIVTAEDGKRKNQAFQCLLELNVKAFISVVFCHKDTSAAVMR
jgi:hypothetical protein